MLIHNLKLEIHSLNLSIDGIGKFEEESFNEYSLDFIVVNDVPILKFNCYFLDKCPSAELDRMIKSRFNSAMKNLENTELYVVLIGVVDLVKNGVVFTVKSESIRVRLRCLEHLLEDLEVGRDSVERDLYSKLFRIGCSKTELDEKLKFDIRVYTAY